MLLDLEIHKFLKQRKLIQLWLFSQNNSDSHYIFNKHKRCTREKKMAREKRKFYIQVLVSKKSQEKFYIVSINSIFWSSEENANSHNITSYNCVTFSNEKNKKTKYWPLIPRYKNWPCGFLQFCSIIKGINNYSVVINTIFSFL